MFLVIIMNRKIRQLLMQRYSIFNLVYFVQYQSFHKSNSWRKIIKNPDIESDVSTKRITKTLSIDVNAINNLEEKQIT